MSTISNVLKNGIVNRSIMISVLNFLRGYLRVRNVSNSCLSAICHACLCLSIGTVFTLTISLDRL